MLNSYMTLPIATIAKELAFDEVPQAHDFLTAHGIAIYSAAKNPTASLSERSIDCKAAFPIITRVYEEKTRRIAIQGSI